MNPYLPTRADIEAYHCPCSLDSGILTTDSGAQIDLGKILDTYNQMFYALIGVTKPLVDGTFDCSRNPYRSPWVEDALKAIATATGRSTFGNDWMDALDQQGD